MTSELRVNTLKDASGNNSIATSFVAGGSAKVYIRRDFNNNVTDSSLNITSVTDNALGDQTMNITSTMSAATYSIVGMASRKANSLSYHVVMVHESADPTTSAYRLRVANVFGDDKDAEFVSTSVDGDLA
jgi:hypothetical protein